jgi:hypothetical protein
MYSYDRAGLALRQVFCHMGILGYTRGMATTALEFVPPALEDGMRKAEEEAAKAQELLRSTGLASSVNSVLFPGMIAEESDRPVPLSARMDPIDTKHAIQGTLPLAPIVTQVTAFSDQDELNERLKRLSAAGIHRVVFVGVPRTLAEGQGPGLAPTDALGAFRDTVPSRGVVFIPTRESEKPRFEAKVRAGADFGLSQLLYSDHVVDVLQSLEIDEPQPEILLSFGYVPKAEERVGLIRWLIRDETEAAKRELEAVSRIAPMPFAQKKAAMVDLYKRITDGARKTGFPIGLHFETPYGFSKPAFETFAAMLDEWNPHKHHSERKEL